MEEVRHGDQEPQYYQIRIAGHLDESWSPWLSCAAVSFEVDGEAQTPVTVLTTQVIDQSALHGLLNKLFDLNLTILSVIRCDLDEEESNDENEGK